MGLDLAGTYFSGGTLALVGMSQLGAVTGGTVTTAGVVTLTDAISRMGVASSTVSFSFAQNYGERQNSLHPNGTYEPSPKHNPQSGWGNPDNIPDLETGQELLDTAYSTEGKKQLYNIYEGKLIKFQPDTTGTWYAYEVTENIQRDIPNSVLRAMKKDGVITNAQYNKFISK